MALTVLFLILAIIPYVHSKTLSDLDSVIKDKNDKNQKTIPNEYIVFFDKKCTKQHPQRAPNFAKAFEPCFTIDQKADHFPNIMDHWIKLKKKQTAKKACNVEGKKELLTKYCVSNVHADETDEGEATNDCKWRPVSATKLWNLNQATPSRKLGFEYIKYDKSFDDEFLMGVSSSDRTKDAFTFDNDAISYSLSSSGKTYVNCNNEIDDGPISSPIKPNEVVTIVMNLSKKNLAFCVNDGVELVKFDDINVGMEIEYRLSVSIIADDEDAKVTLISFTEQNLL